jgi:hypothetical protein
MAVVAVKCGSIDPSAFNFHLWSNRPFAGVSHPSKVRLLDCWCRGPEIRHMVGAGAPVGAAMPSPCQLRPTLASCGRLSPAAAGCGVAEPGYVRPDMARCGRTWPGVPDPAPLLWCSPIMFICSLFFLYLCAYK